jgi:hypothetical protein
MEDTDENRRAHLTQIQLVISRMAANSFLLKGWSVTLVAALFALASVDSRQEFAFLALLPAIVFWGLDAYYLRQERLFRKLYDDIRAAPLGTLKDTFSMDTSPYESKVRSLWATIRTPTVGVFHGAIVVAVIAGIIVLAAKGGDQPCHPGHVVSSSALTLTTTRF